MTLTIGIMAAATLLFLLLSYLNFGITTSISATTYLFKKERVWLFWLWLTIVAVGTVIEMPNLYGVIASGGFAATGVTIWHNKENPIQSGVHTIATIIAVTAMFLSLTIGYGLWEYSAIMLAGGLALYFFSGQNKIYYIELLAIVLGFIAMVSK